MSATLDPAGPIAPPQAPKTHPTKCTVCADPRCADINTALATQSIRKVCNEFGINLGAMSRHARNHARGNAMQPNAPRDAVAVTIRHARKVAQTAMRHLRSAQDSAEPKDVNGAIQAAVKAIQLQGEALGELQRGGQVNVQVNAIQQAAMALHESASRMDAGAVIVEAEGWLDAQAGAGDAHAMAAIARLSRKHLPVEPHAP